MNSPAGGSALSQVRQLLHFRIHKTSQGGQHEQIALFRNGRQQCPIKVAIIAADENGDVVNLTDDEVYGALGLVRYDDGTTVGDNVTVDRVKSKFEWDESVISASGRIFREPAQDPGRGAPRPVTEVTPQAPSIYTLYVSAKPAAQDFDLAASFAVPGYMTFATNSDADDPDGNGEDGQFNSSVELLLADSPYLAPADFGAAANGVVTGRKVGDWSSHFFWATEYYLDPQLNGKRLKLDSVGSHVSETTKADGTREWSANGEFGVYTYGDFFSSVTWGISYVGTPGSETASSQSVGDLDHIAVAKQPSAMPLDTYTPETMFSMCCKDGIAGANANRVVIGLLKGNLAATFRSIGGGEIAEVTSTTFHILDKYGNDYALSLSYDATADELSIA